MPFMSEFLGGLNQGPINPSQVRPAATATVETNASSTRRLVNAIINRESLGGLPPPPTGYPSEVRPTTTATVETDAAYTSRLANAMLNRQSLGGLHPPPTGLSSLPSANHSQPSAPKPQTSSQAKTSAKDRNAAKRKAKIDASEAAKAPEDRLLNRTDFEDHINKQLALSTEVAIESMKSWFVEYATSEHVQLCTTEDDAQKYFTRDGPPFATKIVRQFTEFLLDSREGRSRNQIERDGIRAGHVWIDGPLANAGRTNLFPRLKQMATPNDVTRLLGALFSIEHMTTQYTTRNILYTSLFLNLAIDCSGRIGEFLKGAPQRHPKYLKWKQVSFYCFRSSPNQDKTILAKIRWDDLKGSKGSLAERSKTIPLRMLPLSLWTQDSLKQLLVLAIMDKVLPQITRWDDIQQLQSSPDGVRLDMDPIKAYEPVFRHVTPDHTISCEPVSSLNMGAWLSRLGIRLGLENRLVSYCLRRGAAYVLAMKCSEQERCNRMGHLPGDASYWKYYRCETSTVDFQGLARDIEQEDVARLSSISLNRREHAVKFLSASGFAEVSKNPEVIALVDIEISILDRILTAHGSLRNAREVQDPDYGLYVQGQTKTNTRFCSCELIGGFMQDFNDPEYSCFSLEKTNIHEDLVEGRTNLQNHDEVRTNPLFASKEGKAVIAQMKADLRRAVVSRISTLLKTKVNEEQAHTEFDDELQDRILSQADNFQKMMQHYNGPKDDGEAEVEWSVNRLSTVDKMTTTRFAPPGR